MNVWMKVQVEGEWTSHLSFFGTEKLLIMNIGRRLMMNFAPSTLLDDKFQTAQLVKAENFAPHQQHRDETPENSSSSSSCTLKSRSIGSHEIQFELFSVLRRFQFAPNLMDIKFFNSFLVSQAQKLEIESQFQAARRNCKSRNNFKEVHSGNWWKKFISAAVKLAGELSRCWRLKTLNKQPKLSNSKAWKK